MLLSKLEQKRLEMTYWNSCGMFLRKRTLTEHFNENTPVYLLDEQCVCLWVNKHIAVNAWVLSYLSQRLI